MITFISNETFAQATILQYLYVLKKKCVSHLGILCALLRYESAAKCRICLCYTMITYNSSLRRFQNFGCDNFLTRGGTRSCKMHIGCYFAGKHDCWLTKRYLRFLWVTHQVDTHAYGTFQV